MILNKTAKLLCVLFIALIIFLFSACNCTDDDDDDEGSSDDDDDNDLADDDNSPSDDDATDPDDDNTVMDEPVVNDTIIEPTQAVLIGYAGNETYYSWQLTDEGWEPRYIPRPDCPLGCDQQFLEATAAYNGEKIWAAYNCNMLHDYHPQGHDWMAIEKGGAWSDVKMGSPLMSNILHIAPVGLNHVYYLAEGYYWQASLYENTDRHSERIFFHPYIPLNFQALGFADEQTGLASAYDKAIPLAHGKLIRYDAMQTDPWTVHDMPPGLEYRLFDHIHPTSTDHAWGILDDHVLYEYEQGYWTPVDFPGACDQMGAYSFAATGEDLAVIGYHSQNLFAVKQDGQWCCREIPAASHELRLTLVLLLRDGTVYLTAEEDDAMFLFRVTEDEIERREIPEEVRKLVGLHAFGPLAPFSSDYSHFY